MVRDPLRFDGEATASWSTAYRNLREVRMEFAIFCTRSECLLPYVVGGRFGRVAGRHGLLSASVYSSRQYPMTLSVVAIFTVHLRMASAPSSEVGDAAGDSIRQQGYEKGPYSLHRGIGRAGVGGQDHSH